MPLLSFFLVLCATTGHHPGVECAEEVQVHLQMREETPLFTRIGSVTSSLPPNIGKQLHFLTDSSFFSVAPSSGDVTVARIIDRERLCPDYKQCCGVIACQLDARIFVTNKESGEFAASVILKVDIQDQNDNRPSFAVTSQTVSLSENAPVGSYVTLASATDADIEPINQIQSYTLLEPTKTFRLDLVELPTVRLQLATPLDREKTPAYTATLEACDPGACTRQNVEIKVLDENDNRPKFINTRITRRLIEDTAVGSVVLHLNATDADLGERGRVLYTMQGNIDPDLAETFELVQSTGEIRIRRQLAANIRTNYRFKVVACDAVNPSCGGDENSTVDITFLVEDINNYPPTIHAVPAGVTSSSDTQLGRVGTSDSQQRPLDGASDDAVSVFENTPPSQVIVITVRDNDLGENARVSCQLNDSVKSSSAGSYQPTGDFLLAPSSPGIYSLRTARMFDHEVEPTVSTTVVCHDYGRPHRLTSARVISVRVLDVNEYQPEFSRRVYVGRVAENTPAGTEVLNPTATDRDRGALLRYAFAAPPSHQRQVDPWTTSDLAKGGETHASTPTVTNSDTLRLAADPIHASTAASVSGIDKIGVNKYFAIDPETGVIRTSQVPLDRETLASAVLVVTVTDSNFPPVYTATTTLSIEVLDENDNAPVFINPPGDPLAQTGGGGGSQLSNHPVAFTVTENSPRFTRLSQKLEAQDPDQGDNGRVHFSLLETYSFTDGFHSNNGLGAGLGTTSSLVGFVNDLELSQRIVDQPIFRINPDGYIETLLELDREKTLMYLLKIGVYDRGAQPLASTVLLQVNVLDVNDNAPVWIFPTPNDRVINLTTAMKPGSLAGRLRAEDIDSGEAGKVDYLFLGPRGELLTGVSMQEGLLSSIVPGNGKSVEQATQAGGKLPPVTDSDKLSDRNGYRFGPLYLNGSTGEIWIAKALTPGTVDLHLRAQDRGSPKSQTDAWLTINFFIDPNEDPGFFNFGGDGTLNVTIILSMITITAIVSLFLIIGIVCVRRRPTRYTTNCSPMPTQQPSNGPGSPESHLSSGGYLLDGHQHKAELAGVNWAGGQAYAAGPGGYTGTGPMLDDGQLFAAFAAPTGLVGYGPMGVGANADNASLIYVSQSGVVSPITAQHQQQHQHHQQQTMHTFGTLTRGGRGGYPGYAAAGYEPHLDADSGDSGRGPSEEGHQFLLSEGYRNGSGLPVQYSTLAGYRPSSQLGYYRPSPAVELGGGDGGGGGLLTPPGTSSVSNGNGTTCACYLSPDGTTGVLYPVGHSLDPNDSALVHTIYNGGVGVSTGPGGLMLAASSPTVVAPTPPPRSPRSSESSRLQQQQTRLGHLYHLPLPPLASQPCELDRLPAAYLTSANQSAGQANGLDDSYEDGSQDPAVDCGVASATPLRLDLRELPADGGRAVGNDDIDTAGESVLRKQTRWTGGGRGTSLGLPPLATKSNGGGVVDHGKQVLSLKQNNSNSGGVQRNQYGLLSGSLD